MKRVFLIFFLMAVMLAASSSAEEARVTGSGSIVIFNKYIFRDMSAAGKKVDRSAYNVNGHLDKPLVGGLNITLNF